MTLAALTPLATWWPLFIGTLVLWVTLWAPRIRARQHSPWPPPVVLTYPTPLPLPPPTIDWVAFDVWLNE